jgi:choline kinase
MPNNHYDKIDTAVILAAGMGHRLQPLTSSMPKCLTEVDEKPILDYLIRCLQQHNFKRLIVVVGYLEQSIRDLLDQVAEDVVVEYVVNPIYSTTNNMYSLWLAREKIQDPFLLIESDLIFDPDLLEQMLVPDRIAVSQMLPWMNGTTVSIDEVSPNNVAAFHAKGQLNSNETRYKTVNISSFSMASWQKISQRLDEHVLMGRVNDYYESVFADLIAEGALALQPVLFNSDRWYEIDTLTDLNQCELMFHQIRNTNQVLNTTDYDQLILHE